MKSSKGIEILISENDSIPAKMGEIMGLVTRGIVAGPVLVTLGRLTRTIEQNLKMWPMLSDLSKQAEYMGRKWKSEDWKIYCYSAWRIMDGKQCRVVMGLEGEMVALDYSTKVLSKKDFASLIEAIYSIGSRFGVKWSEKSISVYEEYREFQE